MCIFLFMCVPEHQENDHHCSHSRSLNMFMRVTHDVGAWAVHLNSGLLISRCSGGEAALRSEQTRHHGCGWGGEYEWVHTVPPSSLVGAKAGLVLFCFVFLSFCLHVFPHISSCQSLMCNQCECLFTDITQVLMCYSTFNTTKKEEKTHILFSFFEILKKNKKHTA